MVAILSIILKMIAQPSARPALGNKDPENYLANKWKRNAYHIASMI